MGKRILHIALAAILGFVGIETMLAQGSLRIAFDGKDNANWVTANGSSMVVKDGHMTCTMANQNDQTQKVYTLNHPCALFGGDDIARVQERLRTATAGDLVYNSWKRLESSSFSKATYTGNPQEILVRGDVTGTGLAKENYIIADRDAAAAVQLALRWRISGEEQYAEAAVSLLNQWAGVCKRITANDANQYLLAGFQGYQFANAAELLSDYEGWTSEEQDKYKTWLETVWATKNYEFLQNHCGTVDLHYWSNWDLANMASYLAIGIYTENQEKINYVINYFKNGVGGGCINNMIPYSPVADPVGMTVAIAQNMESGRDQGHSTLVASMCAEFCQMAFNIGEDLFGYDDNKVLRMFEYVAKYNVKPRENGGEYLCTTSDMPFTKYVYHKDTNAANDITHTAVSEVGRGTERPCWDLVYNHYAKIAKLEPDNYYYTALFADQLRYTDGVLTGDCGAGDARYGTTSGAYDQIGWGSLMFTR